MFLIKGLHGHIVFLNEVSEEEPSVEIVGEQIECFLRFGGILCAALEDPFEAEDGKDAREGLVGVDGDHLLGELLAHARLGEEVADVDDQV